MTLFTAEAGTDESDSEGGYLDHEGVGGLDELSSDVEIQFGDSELDAASSDGEYVVPLLPFSLH
jgi:hypothetical protein